MAIVRIGSEEQLINEIKRSAPYKDFIGFRFKNKVEREQKAWALIEMHKGRYTKDLIDEVLYIVDREEGKGWWFGLTIASNKKKILKTPIEKLSTWIEYICFSGRAPTEILDKCLGEMRIKGASKGLVTILLYLSDPSKHAIWVPTTYQGLSILGRIKESNETGWGAKYAEFSNGALEFARQYLFDYRELDWVLWFISSIVTKDGEHFAVDQGGLISSSVQVAVNDIGNSSNDAVEECKQNVIEPSTEPPIRQKVIEADTPNVYGDFINFRGLQHAPVNEQGVVFLFGMICRELGYVVEIVRSGFPDCEAKRPIRGKPSMWQRVRIEFEYQSKAFRVHGHDSNVCDLIVCWEHNWPECPIEVLELRSALKKLSAEVGG